MVLGMRSSSYEEALEHFRRAEEQGQQVLLPNRLEEAIIADDIWVRVPLRAWCRCGHAGPLTASALGARPCSTAAAAAAHAAVALHHSLPRYTTTRLVLLHCVPLPAALPGASTEWATRCARWGTTPRR